MWRMRKVKRDKRKGCFKCMLWRIRTVERDKLEFDKVVALEPGRDTETFLARPRNRKNWALMILYAQCSVHFFHTALTWSFARSEAKSHWIWRKKKWLNNIWCEGGGLSGNGIMVLLFYCSLNTRMEMSESKLDSDSKYEI